MSNRGVTDENYIRHRMINYRFRACTYLSKMRVRKHDKRSLNLQEPCVVYIGRAYRYSPDVAFYILFQQI
jgi:hypothetical protein